FEEDTRRNFVSHLYNSFELRGIRTFKDEERLEPGKSISDELLKAIQESKFAIVIFSKSYASSRWCLKELAHIIKCKKELEQIFIPVFYDVSVSHQHLPFVQRWRGAFAEAGKISGKLHQKNGLTWLQKVVIHKLLGEKSTLTSEHEGVNILNNILRWKKVLFIIDDLNHQEQLEFLVGGTKWFVMGSKIILTEDETLELLSRHAFREKSPKEDFMKFSRQVVNHAGGLPLALKILGSSFYGRDIKHSIYIIDRLKRIPHKDILGTLVLSFDGLGKDEKELFLDIVFLDIACLTRYDFHLCVELVLRDVGQDFLIDYLIEKSLLSINISNSMVMHNMIREMGENVIREEYDNSRIWLSEEVCDLFKENLVTITYLPSSLRLISWPRYPSISLPESFEPSQLLVLCLHRSWLVELWPTSKVYSLSQYLISLM
uniref:TIR domain-containing protein n=1 Tax=Solanum lycopersicum TaxID=4081 RepID=A0A3Q7IXF0_SOLLC